MKQLKREIQKDLDNGKYGMICSNESTFKNYVFPKIEEAYQQGKKEGIEIESYGKQIDADNLDSQYQLGKKEVIEEIKKEIIKLVRSHNSFPYLDALGDVEDILNKLIK